MAAALHENVNYDGIAFCFQKHPVNSMAWLSSLLNTYYGKTISVAKYENLFTTVNFDFDFVVFNFGEFKHASFFLISLLIGVFVAFTIGFDFNFVMHNFDDFHFEFNFNFDEFDF